MQLIYRGTTLNYNPAHVNARRSVQRSESAYELIYRGNTYRIDPNATTTASQKTMKYKLIYRGSTYQAGQNEQDETIAIASINSSKYGTKITHPTMQKAASEYSL